MTRAEALKFLYELYGRRAFARYQPHHADGKYAVGHSVLCSDGTWQEIVTARGNSWQAACRQAK